MGRLRRACCCLDGGDGVLGVLFDVMEQEVVFGWEVGEERASRDARAFGDVVDRRPGEAAFEEERCRGVDDRLSGRLLFPLPQPGCCHVRQSRPIDQRMHECKNALMQKYVWGALEGRTVLVTGAGRGIGRAEALQLAEAGANVLVNDAGVEIDGAGRDASVAAKVVQEISAAGGRALANTGDVSDWDDARSMVEQAVEHFGHLDAVVNNAAVEANKPVEALTESEFERVIRVKLFGSFAVARWAADYWRRNGQPAHRCIVNTVSGSGLTNSLPLQSNYAAANAGVAALTTVQALELKRLGVRVNAVSPSMIRTRLTESVPGMTVDPQNSGYDPRDPMVLTPMVSYLASRACEVTGQFFSVRGSAVNVLQGWTRGAGIDKPNQPWTPDELAERIPPLITADPFDHLAEALGGALGGAGRGQLESMIEAQLNAQVAASTSS